MAERDRNRGIRSRASFWLHDPLGSGSRRRELRRALGSPRRLSRRTCVVPTSDGPARRSQRDPARLQHRRRVFRGSCGATLCRWPARGTLVRQAPARVDLRNRRRNDVRSVHADSLAPRPRHQPGQSVDAGLARGCDSSPAIRRARALAAPGPVLSAARQCLRVRRLAVCERARADGAAQLVENSCHDFLRSPRALRLFCASQRRPPQLASPGAPLSGLVARRRDLPQPQGWTNLRSRASSRKRSPRSPRERLFLLLGVHLLGTVGRIRRDQPVAPPQATAQPDGDGAPVRAGGSQLDRCRSQN